MSKQSAGWSQGVVAAAQKRVRADYFVGRAAELSDFAERLATGDSPRILFVHGPGGIGKSSLLDGFQAIAEGADCGFVRLDARQLSPTPPAVNQAVADALQALPPGRARPRVLALDHVERLSALDGWLRSRLLPQLPADLLLVLAARQGPDALWRVDPGISELLTEYVLAPLEDDAVVDYLQRRGIDNDQVEAVRAFARGHPLPLALAADQVLREPGRLFDVDRFPDLIRALVQWLLHDVEHPEELQSLQACATVRRLDEPLLAAMLEREDVSRQFDRLADQHYVERQADGLVIHDLVREIVIRDLRTRNLERHHRLVRRAVNHLMTGADTVLQRFQTKTVPDIIYALRHEEHIRDQFGFGAVTCYPDAAQPDEVAGLAAEVERLEGTQSRSWFEHWVQEPSSELMVLRGTAQQPVALALFLRLDAAAMEAGDADPCLRAFLKHLCAHAPLRDSEEVLLVRFRMAHGSHQAPTPAWAELRSHLNGRMFTPGISMLASVADLAYPWIGMEDNAEYRLLSDSEYSIGEHRYKISAHDLRREPALEWAHNSIERVLRGGHAPELKPAPVTLLDEPAFSRAVRELLRHFRDDRVLAASPLLHAPMLRRHAAERTVATLRDLVQQISARQLGDAHALLERACFHPVAVKQQAIDSELCMSERTLRRRLRDAQAHLTAVLWELDTHP